MPVFRTANADANANPPHWAKMGEIARSDSADSAALSALSAVASRLPAKRRNERIFSSFVFVDFVAIFANWQIWQKFVV
jgi:hypothetical protein